VSTEKVVIVSLVFLLVISFSSVFAQEPSFELIDHLDRVFQRVFDNNSSFPGLDEKVIFVSAAMRSIQPRGPSFSDSTLLTSDTGGITERLIGPRTPKVYGTGTDIVCGDKLCRPHPFQSKFNELRKEVKSNNTTGVMIILNEISRELATKYPNQSERLQEYLSEVVMQVHAESRIPKDADITCEGKIWLENIKGKLACVFPSTAKKLVERGWGKILE